MAGERKGKTYEAIVKLVLDRLAADGVVTEPIHWNVRPDGMTIEPDFTIGADRNRPRLLLLVTHSGSAKESEKKFWRNIGELAEAKSTLKDVPRVLSIAFDAEIKQDLKVVQASAFDGQLIAGDQPYGAGLEEWIDENHGALPTPGDEKVVALAGIAKTDKALKGALAALKQDIKVLLKGHQPALDHLWKAHRQRPATEAPTAKETFYRRGFTKAMVLGVKPSDMAKPLKGNWDWALPLGLVKKSLVGYRVVDEDLLWLSKSPLREVDPKSWAGTYVSQGFRDQVQKVRSVALLSEFQRYVVEHLEELQTTTGMNKHLTLLYKNPGLGLTLPKGVPAPTGVWLFDYVGALVKAKAKKSQAFGFSAFSSHAKSAATKVGNMDLGTWCTCFMNQFFTRKAGFSAPIAAVAYVSEVLAEQVAKFTAKGIENLAAELQERYVKKELVAVLLTHRGFDPIGCLVEKVIGTEPMSRVRYQAGFAERCGIGGSAASTSVLVVRNSLINWQSAHESHTNDKRKELCGRAPALRYAWNPGSSTFAPRRGIKKLILIVDGTWSQEDLRALAKSGWDDILYPDQLEELVSKLA